MVGASKHGAAFVQVLGVGGGGKQIDGAALLAVGRQRVLINCNEGMQRFCAEHRAKLSRVSKVLFTRCEPHATGGLPGMLLSLAELECKSNLFISGPQSLQHSLSAASRLLPKTTPGFESHLLPPQPSGPSIVADEELIAINALQLGSTPAQPECKNETDDADAEANQRPLKQQRSQNSHPVSTNVHETKLHPSSTTAIAPRVCYACRIADLPGKFNTARAKELGVPQGPAFGKLVNGESVAASDGSLVSPEDVVGPSTPGPLALILDLPSESHVLELYERFQQLTSETPTCAVHLVPDEVVRTDSFRRLVHSFGSKCSNIVVNDSTLARHVPFRNAALLQGKLNYLNSSLFASPSLPQSERVGSTPDVHLCDGTELLAGENMTTFHLRPINWQGLDRKPEPEPLTHEDVYNELMRDHLDACDAAKVGASTTSSNTLKDDFQVTFLGTGAAIPSKYRNVTGIHVDFHDRGSMLLDCGEGSLEQLRACFGRERLGYELRRLRAIWISHIHADHHVGLSSILDARATELASTNGTSVSNVAKIPVIGPKPLYPYLSDMSRLTELCYEWQDSSHTSRGALSDCRGSVHSALKALGLTSLQSVPVDHCANAYACVLQSGEANAKLAYSGDTRPCEALTKAASNASLLIHEATFEDSLVDEAIEKKHSLVREAVGVGQQAGARATVLTHFSQRYPKMPILSGEHAKHTGVAFDMLTISPTSVSQLTGLKEALDFLFKDSRESEAWASLSPAAVLQEGDDN